MVTNMTDMHDQPGSPAQDQTSFPSGQPPASAPTPERPVSVVAIAAMVCVAALLLGGVGGYLLGQRSSERDVTSSGKISYACAIVEKVLEDRRHKDDWSPIGEDDSYNDVGAISSLLGAFVPLTNPADERFSELGRDISQAVHNFQWDGLTAALDATQTECESR